jgi:hypothetical protein
VQGTTECHHQIADACFPEAEPVFDNATALDTAGHMRDPQPTLVERLVGPLLFPRQLLAAWLFGRHEDLHLRERKGQDAQSLQQPPPGWEPVGGGLRDAQIMDPAAVCIAQKEDQEEGIDEQDIF